MLSEPIFLGGEQQISKFELTKSRKNIAVRVRT